MKIFCFILSFCMIFIFFTGCSNSQKQPIEDSQNKLVSNIEVSSPERTVQAKQWNNTALLPGLRKIIEKGTLTVAMIRNDVEVFCETEEDGTLTGIDVQWAQRIADSLGVTLTINRDSETYDKLTEYLIDGKADIAISTYSLTTDRAAYVNISNPYLISRLGIMVNKQELVEKQIENDPIDYMKNNNIKIGALRATSHVKLISEMFPNAEIVEMDTYDQLCQAVRSPDDDVLGYLCGEIEFIFNYVNDPELSLYTKVFVFSDAAEYYCVGVAPDNSDLLKFVNTCIDTYRLSTVEEVEEICNKNTNQNGE